MQMGERIEARRRELKIPSQAALARNAGVPQSTMNGIVNRPYRWSPHLVRLARELRTSVAYLAGETDNPDDEAPPVPMLDADAREMVDLLPKLEAVDRRALLQIARSMNTKAASSTVHAPSGHAYRGEDERR